jgi:FixJ family two-component response regulator
MVSNQHEKKSLYLVHWNEAEAQELSSTLQEQGWRVTVHHSLGQFKMGELRQDPPAAILISLRRLPSHGREIADAIGSVIWGKQIPIIFMDGKPEKLPALQEQFPGAVFTTWENLVSALEDL